MKMISIKERLPEPHTLVIMCRSQHSNDNKVSAFDYYVGRFSEGVWSYYIDDKIFYAKGITHWTPLDWNTEPDIKPSSTVEELLTLKVTLETEEEEGISYKSVHVKSSDRDYYLKDMGVYITKETTEDIKIIDILISEATGAIIALLGKNLHTQLKHLFEPKPEN